jgi:adenosylcobyric acid synthase
VSDLVWLRERGIAEAISERARGGGLVLGVCGGCQMLGEWIRDPLAVESPEPLVAGLGLLPLGTRFQREKTTAQVRARIGSPSFLGERGAGPERLSAYEIHMGSVERTSGTAAAFEVESGDGRERRGLDGAVSESGTVVGTMLHGIFENSSVRACLLGRLRARRGLPSAGASAIPSREAEYDRLAEVVRQNIDEAELHRILAASPLG